MKMNIPPCNNSSTELKIQISLCYTGKMNSPCRVVGTPLTDTLYIGVCIHRLHKWLIEHDLKGDDGSLTCNLCVHII